MAGDRTLKLSILADISNLSKELNKGEKEVEGFGTQIAKISEKAVKSFALVGAAVGAASLAFAKAAAEDEQSANKLARTIEAVTGATIEQTKAVEDYITQTSIATGITDDQLRPAYERLVRSTKNVDDATKLLNLSLDLAAATGKPLEAIAAALGRAYDGNTTALGRLGLGLDANLIKSKDFNAIYEQLNTTFGEFSERRSDEAIVKFQRLQVALDEAKEAVGAALLPAFEALGDWLLTEGVPRLNAFIAGLTGNQSLSASFNQAQKDSEAFGQKIRNIINTVIEYKDVLIATAAVTGTIFVVSKIAAGVTATIALIKSLVLALNALKTSAIISGAALAFALNPALGIAAGTAALAGIGLLSKKLSETDVKVESAPSYNEMRAAQIAAGSAAAGTGITSFSGGGISSAVSSASSSISRSTAGASALKAAPSLIEQVSQANAEKYFMPSSSIGAGDVRMRDNAPINITVNGAVDAASTARQIAEILNSEAAASGSFSQLGVSRFATRVG